MHLCAPVTPAYLLINKAPRLSWVYNSSSFPSEWNLSLFPENSSTRSFIANKHSFLPMLTIGLLLSRTCSVDLVNLRGLYENLPAQLSVNILKHLNWAKVTDRPPLILPDCSYLNILKTLDQGYCGNRVRAEAGR